MKSSLHPALATLALAAVLFPAAAHAGLRWDLRAVSVTGDGAVVNAKTVSLDATAGPGTLVALELWAVVTGTDPNLAEGFQLGVGSLVSSPGTVANTDLGVAGNSGVSSLPPPNIIKGNLQNALLAVWKTGSGFFDGAVTDLDGDGDLDVGGSSTAGPRAAPETYLFARAATMQDGTGLSPNDFHTLSDGREFKVSDVNFAVQSIGGTGGIALNFMVPAFTSFPFEFGRAVFARDAFTQNGSDSNVAVGAPVMVNSVAPVPEPGSATLVLAGVGMLCTRRRRR